jgi:hypothetical protein
MVLWVVESKAREDNQLISTIYEEIVTWIQNKIKRLIINSSVETETDRDTRLGYKSSPVAKWMFE